MRLDGSYQDCHDWTEVTAPFDFKIHGLSAFFVDWSDVLGLETKTTLMRVNTFDDHANDPSYFLTTSLAHDENVDYFLVS